MHYTSLLGIFKILSFITYIRAEIHSNVPHQGFLTPANFLQTITLPDKDQVIVSFIYANGMYKCILRNY